MNFLKATILRSNGIATSVLTLLNISRIVASEQFGSGTLIKYKRQKSGTLFIDNILIDTAYATVKSAIQLYGSGVTIELAVTAINGVATSQTLSLQVDSIVEAVAIGSSSLLVYVENNVEYNYLVSATLDDIIGLTEQTTEEPQIDIPFNGTVAVPYDTFTGGAQSFAIDSVTTVPKTIKIAGDKTALLDHVTQVTSSGLAATYDVVSIAFTAGKTVITVVQDPTGDSGNLSWTTARFAVGEVITETTTGNTGAVVSDTGTILTLKNTTGKFNDNDGFSGATSLGVADVNGTPTYSIIDMTGLAYVNVINLSSVNAEEAIGSISNTIEGQTFEIRAKGNSEFRIVNGVIKTILGADIFMNGNTGDWAKFQNRGGVIYQLAGGQYTI